MTQRCLGLAIPEGIRTLTIGYGNNIGTLIIPKSCVYIKGEDDDPNLVSFKDVT